MSSYFENSRTKSLLLVRHAKSSWEDIHQKDFDRPLNDRGKKDAPEMAKRIRKEKDVKLDTIITSPAKRAMATAKYFAEEFDVKKKKIIEADELYEASITNFYEAVNKLDDNFNIVGLFSHNPGITAFVNSLSQTHIDDMPTCAVFAIHIKTDSWKNFKEAEKEFWFFDYPKNTV